VYENYPASDYAAISLYNAGTIQFNRKNWKKSFTAYQKLLAFHPYFPRFNEVINYQFKIALACADGDNVRFLWVIPYRALNRSTAYFEVIVNNAPYSDVAPLALMNVALLHQYKDQTAGAIDALDRMINNYPTSLLADDAYLSLAETFSTLVQGPEYDQGATREAMSYFEDFLILYSENEKVAQAENGLANMEDVYARSKLILGEYYFKYRGWYQAAEIFFNEAITAAPDSPAAEKAREYITKIEEKRAYNIENAEDFEQKRREESFIKRFFKRIIS
jgi:outer membrane protein assembly factor BamD